MIEIRQERESDYEEVGQVIKFAFASAEHCDGNEADLVANLRKSQAFIPELSLVAVEQQKVIGHILFSKVKIGEKTEFALAPLAVLPEYQRKGIGKSLIQEGHRIAQQLNYDYSIVLGSPNYYSKFGCIPASQYQITAPFPVEDEFFMALKLNAKADAVNGVVEYDPAFGIC